MTSTSTAYVTRTKVSAFTAVLAGLSLALTACGGMGGSKLDGEYYSDMGQVVVKDSTLTYTGFDCDASSKAVLEDEVSATGQISDDEAQIIWASDDEHVEHDSIGGTVPLTTSSSGDTKTVTFEDFEFRTGDKDTFLADFTESVC